MLPPTSIHSAACRGMVRASLTPKGTTEWGSGQSTALVLVASQEKAGRWALPYGVVGMSVDREGS